MVAEPTISPSRLFCRLTISASGSTKCTRKVPPVISTTMMPRLRMITRPDCWITSVTSLLKVNARRRVPSQKESWET